PPRPLPSPAVGGGWGCSCSTRRRASMPPWSCSRRPSTSRTTPGWCTPACARPMPCTSTCSSSSRRRPRVWARPCATACDAPRPGRATPTPAREAESALVTVVTVRHLCVRWSYDPGRETENATGCASGDRPVELTVLGCSGSFGAPPAGACSGYLVRHGSTAIWMDCGNGTFAHLQEHVSVDELDAVVITHEHPDHSVHP